MQGELQLSHKGYRADYRIISFNHSFYRAELVGFSGIKEDRPPLLVHFIYDHGKAIASSDVVDIARNLITQMNNKTSFEAHSYHK